MNIEAKADAYTKAWSSGNPAAVAAHFAVDGQISVNRGDVLKGTQAITDMAAGFYAAFPDLTLHCDLARWNGSHAVFAWTLEGHHADTKNFVKVGGWEEWELDSDMNITASQGWFDATDYQRQIDGA